MIWETNNKNVCSVFSPPFFYLPLFFHGLCPRPLLGTVYSNDFCVFATGNAGGRCRTRAGFDFVFISPGRQLVDNWENLSCHNTIDPQEVLHPLAKPTAPQHLEAVAQFAARSFRWSWSSNSCLGGTGWQV